MNVYAGLTIKSGDGREVNVHHVAVFGTSEVFWGCYNPDGSLAALYRRSLGAFIDLAEKAVREGASAYSLLIGDDGVFARRGVRG